MRIYELMRAYTAPLTSWLAMDDGTTVYKVTVAQLKAAIYSMLPPLRIAVTTPPTVTQYEWGDAINYGGMVVKAYTVGDNIWADANHPGGVIPTSELTLPFVNAGFNVDDDLSNLKLWQPIAIPGSATFNYSDGTTTINMQMVLGNYEKVVKTVTVTPNTDYVFMLDFQSTPFTENNSPNKHCCMAVMNAMPTNTYIETQTTRLIGMTDTSSSGHYRVYFNSGDLTKVYLVIDWAAVTDGESVTMNYSGIAFARMSGEPVRVPVQWARPGDGRILGSFFQITVIPPAEPVTQTDED